MRCKICDGECRIAFAAEVLGKHRAEYVICSKCGFLSVRDPNWLVESYKSPINISDTGLLQRNIQLSEKASVVIAMFFDRNSSFLDFAGGYGVFTRLMRDIGFDFYWNDPYTQNLFSRGFEYDGNKKIELLTTFESFEHFTDPAAETERMLSVSRNILFTTLLLPDPLPEPGKWWYYGLEHGQHISFYSLNSLRALAARYKLNLYSNGIDLHLMTPLKINPLLFKSVLRLARFGLKKALCGKMASKTFADMIFVSADGKRGK